MYVSIYLTALLLGLFKYVDWCVPDTLKIVHFGKSHTGAATILEGPEQYSITVLINLLAGYLLWITYEKD